MYKTANEYTFKRRRENTHTHCKHVKICDLFDFNFVLKKIDILNVMLIN